MKKEKYMSMKLLYGLAALPLIAGVALAEPVKSNDSKKPMQLTDQQMDKVAAGWDMYHAQFHNTGAVFWSIYETQPLAPYFGPNNSILPGDPKATPKPIPDCAACYLYIANSALSVGSVIFAGP
jgi:hypothetical protein